MRMGAIERFLAVGRVRELSKSLFSSVLYSEDAVRLGLFVGGFAGIYHLVRSLIEKCLPFHPALHCSLPGALAGVCLLLLSHRQGRRSVALYAAARALECAFRSLRGRGLLKFPGVSWQHNDALLFALSSAQVMYAWVVRPDTISQSSRRFIQSAAPVDAVVVDALHRRNRGQAVDMRRLNRFAAAHGVSPPPLTTPYPRVVPAALLTRGRSNARAIRAAFVDAFRRTLPFVLSLSVVPCTMFDLRRALSQPLSTLCNATCRALRSTTVLSSFVAAYMGVVCAHRALFSRDHKLVYWLAGCAAGSAVLLEEKSRRSELALFVLPCAFDSWLQMLAKGQRLPGTALLETALFGASMAALFLFREREPEAMAPLVKSLLTSVVFGCEAATDRTLSKSSSLFQLKLTRNSVLGCALAAGASSGRLSYQCSSPGASSTASNATDPSDPLPPTRAPRPPSAVPAAIDRLAGMVASASAPAMDRSPRSAPAPGGRWSEPELASLRERLERARCSALLHDASQRSAAASQGVAGWRAQQTWVSEAAEGTALSPSVPRATQVGFVLAPGHLQPETCSQGPWLPAMAHDIPTGDNRPDGRHGRAASNHHSDEALDAASVSPRTPATDTLSSSSPPSSASSRSSSPPSSAERRRQSPPGDVRRRPPGRALSLGSLSRALRHAPWASPEQGGAARSVLTRFGSAPTRPGSMLASGAELDAAWELQCMMTVAEVRQRTPLLEGGHPAAAAPQSALPQFVAAAVDAAPVSVAHVQGGGCTRKVIEQLEAAAAESEASDEFAEVELSGRLSPQVEAVFLAHRVLEAPARPR